MIKILVGGLIGWLVGLRFPFLKFVDDTMCVLCELGSSQETEVFPSQKMCTLCFASRFERSLELVNAHKLLTRPQK